ncbi:sortase [Patescibacteria group bacterium]
MALYQYIKIYPKKKRSYQGLSFMFMAIGTIILLWVAWPILSFQLASETLFAQTITPIQSGAENLKSELPNIIVAAAENKNVQGFVNGELSDPNLWYPSKPQKNVVTPVNSYTLSIPKLNIKDVTVTIAGDDLKTSLIHYGGTALPGEYGSSVIFGHSTLPQLFDPKNYHTIFSTLPTLKPASNGVDGDEILIKYDGVTYRYMIYDMVITKPEDLSSLEQKYDSSNITLVTCVPPGTYWERLNVKARLMPLE